MVAHKSCIMLAKSTKHHERSKHIDIKHHAIKERIEKKFIELVYCQSSENVADIMTKGLSNVKFEQHRERLQLC